MARVGEEIVERIAEGEGTTEVIDVWLVGVIGFWDELGCGLWMIGLSREVEGEDIGGCVDGPVLIAGCGLGM